MKTDELSSAKKQTFLNGEVHDWYRIVLGYSDRAVTSVLERFNLPAEALVLDPFCGTGTTLVECMKRGVASVGIDANPSSVFASRVKTQWAIDPTALLDAVLAEVHRRYASFYGDRANRRDPTYLYVLKSGMLDRGWISSKHLTEVIAIKRAIQASKISPRERNLLNLLLMAELVQGASNVKFGPEAYVVKQRPDVDVWSGFLLRVLKAHGDLLESPHLNQRGKAKVYSGDSRECGRILKNLRSKPTAVVTSPPYPAEHDYTRNARLELAFLEEVSDLESLRSIKKRMIRSHTKGIYKADEDAAEVSRFPRIRQLAAEIDGRTAHLEHGFARLYSTVLRAYFGGMRKHFRELNAALAPGARCAYVVGDQASYMKVHIPTAEILGSVARAEGFAVEGIELWRDRRSTLSEVNIHERILFLRRSRR